MTQIPNPKLMMRLCVDHLADSLLDKKWAATQSDLFSVLVIEDWDL